MPQTAVLAEPLNLLLSSSTSEEFFEDDLLSLARRHLKTLLETSLDLEMTAYLGCGRHIRSDTRGDWRNGYYTRDLVTGFGVLERLRIPRCRKGGFEPSLFGRYQRRKEQVDRFVRSLFFLGVSTRGVGEALELLLGFSPSASCVSKVVAGIDEEVKAFHKRPLSDEYRYLFLDGLTVRLKELPQAATRLVLVAYGITTDGRRDLIDYRVVQSESASEWERFLESLYDRGLRGLNLKMLTTDGGSGLKAALPLIYPEIPKQLCWAHKLRNVANYLPKSQQTECVREARPIYLANTRREARKAWNDWEARWAGAAPEAVACLGRDLEWLLTFLNCPQEHRRLVRTTNYIERLIRELRRRTRPMGAFADRPSCDRLFYGVTQRLNRKWRSKKPLPEFTHKN